MDIQELKKQNIQLSDDIEKLVRDFERRTGTTVTSIDLNRATFQTVKEKEGRNVLLNVDLKVEL